MIQINDGRLLTHHSVAHVVNHHIDGRVAGDELIAVARARDGEAARITGELHDATRIHRQPATIDRDMRFLAIRNAEERAAPAGLKVKGSPFRLEEFA